MKDARTDMSTKSARFVACAAEFHKQPPKVAGCGTLFSVLSMVVVVIVVAGERKGRAGEGRRR